MVQIVFVVLRRGFCAAPDVVMVSLTVLCRSRRVSELRICGSRDDTLSERRFMNFTLGLPVGLDVLQSLGLRCRYFILRNLLSVMEVQTLAVGGVVRCCSSHEVKFCHSVEVLPAPLL